MVESAIFWRFCFVSGLLYFAVSAVAALAEQPSLHLPHRSIPPAARSQGLHKKEWSGASEDKRTQARSAQHKNSMQILYEENFVDYSHDWSVYFGPRGIPVDPCHLGPFSIVYHLEGKVLSEGRFSDIDTPPPIPSGTWSGLTSPLAKAHCSIVGDGSHPPILKCGQRLAVAFAKDPEYDGATIVCEKNVTQHHRAYFAEYNA